MPKDKRRSSSPATSHCATPPAPSQALSGITIHVIDAKLDPKEVGDMFSLVQSTGAKLSRAPQNASVLITKLSMKRRLERHVSWDVANTKHVVSPQWLRACAEKKQLVPFAQFEAIKTAASNHRVSLTQTKLSVGKPALISTSAPAPGPSSTCSKRDGSKVESYQQPSSVYRRSPLVCPNQALCSELAILMKARYLEGESKSELGYSRAIATIKAYPNAIKSAVEVRKLPFIGPKIEKLIDEYIKTGRIAEAQEAAASERFKVLSEISEAHGIGPAKAREHCDAGRKTIADLIKFYESKSDQGTHIGIFTALKLHDELQTKISRNNVETIAESVFEQLDAIQPGCEYTICGSYRRGKAYNSDVDLVFTHKEMGTERYLCDKLVDRLSKIGMVKTVLNHTSYSSKHEGVHGRPRATTTMDLLDKALVILKIPNTVHSRVDLVFAPYNVYWTAVVGWTGSKQFGRDLRIHARQKGLKFDSAGITRENNSEPISAYSEEEVFSILGLEYIEPEFRNADV